jgi:sugar-specific transcriptional regulator TrmB
MSQSQIDTLIHLGLTHNQARIYCATLHLGCATVKAIAQCAQIGREDVYRVLPAMQDLGLLKKCIGSPTCYEPVVPHEVMSLLISNRANELAQLRKEALEFVAHCPRGKKKSEDENEKFTMVSNVDLAINTLIDAIKNTKQLWLFTSGYERFIVRQNMPKKSKQIAEMLAALKRGVKIMGVLDQPKDRKKLPLSAFALKESRELVQHQNFEYRYVDSIHAALISIFDNHLMFIETQQGPKVILPQLWSNNQVLLALGNTFFEHAWQSSYIPE